MFSHVRNIGLYAELQRHPLVNSARQCARRLFKYRDCSLKVFQSPLFPSMLSYAEAGLVAATVGSSAYLFYREKLARASKLPLPPSPAGAYPLLGHALALPTSNEHLTYSKWSRELKSELVTKGVERLTNSINRRYYLYDCTRTDHRGSELSRSGNRPHGPPFGYLFGPPRAARYR